MRVPIAVGLAYPERIESGAQRLDFMSQGALSFEAIDPSRFPGLALAYDALRGADGSTTVLNAANEIGVTAFLEGRIRFTDIHRVNAAMLESVQPEPGDAVGLAALLSLDARTRHVATQLTRELAQ